MEERKSQKIILVERKNEMYQQSEITKEALIASGLFMAILCLAFSASYFSYAIAVWVLFLLRDTINSKRNGRCCGISGTEEGTIAIIGIVLFYASLLATCFLHGSPADIRKGFWCAELAVPFFLMYWSSSRYDLSKGIKYGMTVGMAVICLIGLYQYIHNPSERIMATYAHPNHLGTMIDMTVPFMAYYLIKDRRTLSRLIYVALIAMEIIVLWLTGSRGAIMALAAGSVVSAAVTIWIFRKRIDRKSFWRMQLVLIAILIFSSLGTQYLISQRKEARLGGERELMIVSSIAMWEDHKIIGVGMNHWQENYYGKYRPADGKEKGLAMPHNMPLYFLSTAGVIGFAGYLAFLSCGAYALLKAAKKKNDFYWAVAVGTVFMAFFFQGLVDTTIINKIPARMFYALMGYFLTAGLWKERQK